MHADDIVLTAPDEGSLQKLINVVEKWCRRWGMALNIKRTNIVHFRKKQTSRSEYNFIFDDKKIAYTSNYKYLGMLLNEHLDWQGAITEIINKSNKALISSTKPKKQNKRGATLPYLYPTIQSANCPDYHNKCMHLGTQRM